MRSNAKGILLYLLFRKRRPFINCLYQGTWKAVFSVLQNLRQQKPVRTSEKTASPPDSEYSNTLKLDCIHKIIKKNI